MNEPQRIDGLLPFRRPQGPRPAAWVCATCGVMEPLLLPSGKWQRRGCACERAARLAREAEAEHAAIVAKRVQWTFYWLGKEYSPASENTEHPPETCTFDSFMPDLQKELVFRRAKDAARAFAEVPMGNMLLYGPPGQGKTHIMYAICNARHQISSKIPKFVLATQYQLALQKARDFGELGRVHLLLDTMRTCPMLFIDDIGKVLVTAKRESDFFEILNTRMTQNLPTIISTNEEESLAPHIGGLAGLSRFKGKAQVFHMKGKDIRL